MSSGWDDPKQFATKNGKFKGGKLTLSCIHGCLNKTQARLIFLFHSIAFLMQEWQMFSLVIFFYDSDSFCLALSGHLNIGQHKNFHPILVLKVYWFLIYWTQFSMQPYFIQHEK